METLTNFPSLRAIAATLNLQSQQRLYNIAKQPIPGETYDPKVINYNAIVQFINRQLSKSASAPINELTNEPFQSTEEVLQAAAEWDADPANASQRGGGRRSGGTTPKDNSVRKFSFWNLSDENPDPYLCLRNDPHVYRIVYQTQTHTVLRPIVNEDGDWLDESVRVTSNSVLNQKGVGPSAINAEVARRFELRGWEQTETTGNILEESAESVG